MQITSFTISEDKSKLVLNIADAATATSLRLWTDRTYKDFNELKDLSNKLNGTSVQTIEITPLDINETFFDGVYFIELQNSTTVSIDIVAALDKFKECIMDKLVTISDCDECLENNYESIKNSHMILINLEYAVSIKFSNEILKFKKILDKFCSNTCLSCGSNTKVQTSTSLENNNPRSIIVDVDGGSLD